MSAKDTFARLNHCGFVANVVNWGHFNDILLKSHYIPVCSLLYKSRVWLIQSFELRSMSDAAVLY